MPNIKSAPSKLYDLLSFKFLYLNSLFRIHTPILAHAT
jgi:hypothetical protein